MTTDPDALARRLNELAARLDRVEARLGIARSEPAPTPPTTPEAPPVVPSAKREAFRSLVSTPAAPPTQPQQPPPLPTQPTPAPMAPAPPVRPPEPAAPPAAPPAPVPAWTPREPVLPRRTAPVTVPPAAPRPTRPPLNFERVLALAIRIAGPIFVVVAVGLGLYWAYDKGYLRVSPAVRCTSAAAFGLVLMGAGEWLRRRINALAASGAYAAGIGTLYSAVFVAYKLYALLNPAAAFVLMALTAALGIGVGARAKLVFVAIVSLVAGYLTPLLFADQPERALVMPTYLLMLLSVGLVLAGWLGGNFAALRTVVWWGTMLLGGVWALNRGAADAPVAAVFVAVVWCAIHAE